MSASQRRKGAQFERDICNDLKYAGYDAKRNLEQYQKSTGRDITVDAPLCIQTKCGKRPSWIRALMEALASAEDTEYAIAITHDDYGLTVAHIPWTDFLEMLALPDVRHALRRPRLDPPI